MPPAGHTGRVSVDRFYTDNRANWNDRARVHAGSELYRLDQYRNDPACISQVVTFDEDQFGSFEGLSIAHLQCHIGTDTISLERLGAASVVGLDFAPDAISVARELAEATGSGVRFVEASVYDAPAAIGQVRRSISFTPASGRSVGCTTSLDGPRL